MGRCTPGRRDGLVHPGSPFEEKWEQEQRKQLENKERREDPDDRSARS
jgi:hypothetical protein